MGVYLILGRATTTRPPAVSGLEVLQCVTESRSCDSYRWCCAALGTCGSRLDEASRGDERFKTMVMMLAVRLRRGRSGMAELKRSPRAANERASKQARNAMFRMMAGWPVDVSFTCYTSTYFIDTC